MITNPQTLIVSMPLYNSERTVRAAIESVLKQSYRNLRLIIVNDNSTDSSLAIAREYLKDPRVTVLSNSENRGAYYCRNAGISYMANQTWGYFTTHDADDISFHHRYLKLIRMIKYRNNIAVQDTFKRINFHTGEFIKQNMTVAHAVYRREVFDTLGYFEPVRFGADWEYWKRIEAFTKIMDWKQLGTKELMGESFVHGQNITSMIPEGSRQRTLYMKQSRRRIQSRISNNNPYQSFHLDSITSRITS